MAGRPRTDSNITGIIVVVLFSECCGVTRFDGWVVCEEHRESLVYAWEEEQAILRQKELDVCLATLCIIMNCLLFSLNIMYALHLQSCWLGERKGIRH